MGEDKTVKFKSENYLKKEAKECNNLQKTQKHANTCEK